MRHVFLSTADNAYYEALFGRYGYACDSFRTAKELYNKLLFAEPDLIVLDTEQREINAFTLCKRIRKIRQLKQIPVVIITSKYTDKAQLEAQFVGANKLIAKPIVSVHPLLPDNTGNLSANS